LGVGLSEYVAGVCPPADDAAMRAIGIRSWLLISTLFSGFVEAAKERNLHTV
jgi:hypothetical protein